MGGLWKKIKKTSGMKRWILTEEDEFRSKDEFAMIQYFVVDGTRSKEEYWILS